MFEIIPYSLKAKQPNDAHKPKQNNIKSKDGNLEIKSTWNIK